MSGGAITVMAPENIWSASCEKTPEANGIRLHTLALVVFGFNFKENYRRLINILLENGIIPIVQSTLYQEKC
jgi:hypothetical protein